jgi:hypothetical protein
VRWLFGPKQGTELIAFIIGGLVFAAVIVLALAYSPKRHRRSIVSAVTFLAGLFYSVEYFWVGRGPEGDNPLSPMIEPASDLMLVLAGFALGLGTVNLFIVHGRNVRKRARAWHNSAMFFVAFLAMLTFAFLQHYLGGPEESEGTLRNAYDLLFNGMLQPLGATMFSVLAFFIVSASYRAFRIKSAEATLMMAAAFVVMLGQVPIGFWLTQWIPHTGILASLRFENLSYWILTIPNMAAQRGIDFGIGVGFLAMALRIWLSLEKGSYFDSEL